MRRPGQLQPKSGMKENLAWKEIRTEYIAQDEWIDFRNYLTGKYLSPFTATAAKTM